MTHQVADDCSTLSCPLDRRALLLAASLAATATVAACGTDEPAARAQDAGGAAKQGGGAVAGGGAKGGVEGAPPPGTDVPTGALTPVQRVPVGGGVVVEDGKVLVVQPAGGVFKAYDARCPHKGVPVDPPDAEGVVECPRHKARFKAADGSLVKGPAERGLSGIPVKVDGEYVVRA